jgi:threonine synthase
MPFNLIKNSYDFMTFPSVTLNPRLQGFSCIRCHKPYPLSPIHNGCITCREQGHFVSLKASYDQADSGFPNLPFDRFVTLNEGHTPLIEKPALAKLLNVAGVRIKDESRNPTGSHKDRMSAFGVSHALLAGAHTVVLASSGNAAVSAATYAQAAGLKCEIAAYSKLPDVYASAIDELGAARFNFDDNAGRWGFVAQRASQQGYFALTNYHLPALGSAPLSIEGYKNIAYECYAERFLPEHIMVPTARGDLAWGIYAGFNEIFLANKISKLPKIWIVEPFPRLQKVLAGSPLHHNFPGNTGQFSTAGATVTYLQWQVVTDTLSGAVTIDDEKSRIARQTFRQHGFDPELCAAGALPAAQSLRTEGKIVENEQILLIMTANASRDPSATPF